MISETVGLPTNTPKTELTLSVAWEVLLEADRSAAARLEDLLELQHRARILGDRDLAAWYADRIVDEMLGRVIGKVREHIPWRPGARELLEALQNRPQRRWLCRCGETVEGGFDQCWQCGEDMPASAEGAFF